MRMRYTLIKVSRLKEVSDINRMPEIAKDDGRPEGPGPSAKAFRPMPI
jgi:hypothetical protein